MKNKKGLIIALAIIAVIMILAGSIVSSYNSLVDEREAVTNAQANIQTMLQRRADLIPNLVNTVKLRISLRAIRAFRFSTSEQVRVTAFLT